MLSNITNQNETSQGLYQYWAGTYNNPPSDWKGALESFQADYAIGQLEEGDSGTKHIQFMLYFKKQQRASRFKGFPCWISGLRAPIAVERYEKYVQKSETRIEDPYSYGTKPDTFGEKDDAETVVEKLKKGGLQALKPKDQLRYANVAYKITLLAPPPKVLKQPFGLWVYGKKGTGKSYPNLVDETTGERRGDTFIKKQNRWWDGYQGQARVVLDDLDQDGKCLAHDLKLWVDIYRDQGECKGGHVWLSYSEFIVTSNYLPEEIFYEFNEEFLRALKRRFKFRFYTGYRQSIDGPGFGEYPKLDDG